jgi:SAM-dependent methyltransferase
MYDSYAQFYDGSGQIRFSLLFFQYLQDLLALHPLPPQEAGPRRALDLACGTGTLTMLLGDAGWDATGLDRAQAMLEQARRKGATLASAAHWVLGDLRALPRWEQPFDLVTCVYDSLNYLLHEDELRACFVGVAAALRVGGVFVGDMNSRHVLREVWVGDEVLEQPGYIQVGQLAFDEASDSSTLQLTGMVGDDRGGYRRFVERHVQRAYDPELVAEAMARAGLTVEGFYDAFTEDAPGPKAPRFVWVARKR